MSVFGNVSGRDAVKAFQKDGWQVRGQVGSHVVLTKPGFNVAYPYLNIVNLGLV